MEDTHFVNCTGLDDEPSAAEHLTSAYDIALMSRELLLHHPDIKKFTTIWMDTVRNGAFGLANTNKLVRFYEGTTGLKTGYTSSAGHCLSASAQRDGPWCRCRRESPSPRFRWFWERPGRCSPCRLERSSFSLTRACASRLPGPWSWSHLFRRP